MLPLGKAGVLSAEGGAGKTQLLVQLAVSIITGRRWLDHFVVGAEARGKRVLLALAEEDAEEIDRRCYDVAAALQLTADERALVASRLVALPLAGTPVALLRRAEGGSLAETPELASLRRLLTEDAGEGWALVVLDPLSRWAGPDAEAENEAATRTVQALESLVRVPGGPTVLCAAHSSKLARRTGTVDTRGVTAITDGLRWEGQLRVVDAEVHFRQAKSNYSRPMPESREIELVRGADGVLRVPSADERDRRAAEDHGAAERAIGADVARVVDALARERQASSVDAIAGLAGMKLTAGRRAVRLAMDRGLITRVGTAREPLYRVCEETPIPPGTSGRPADVTRETSGTPGGGRPGRSGTSRDVGTSSHWIEQVDP